MTLLKMGCRRVSDLGSNENSLPRNEAHRTDRDSGRHVNAEHAI